MFNKNYDTKDVVQELVKDVRVKIINDNYSKAFIRNNEDTILKMVHEPTKAYSTTEFFLFGHIHNTQKVKRNGLNVGIDCHNYLPINLETVLLLQKCYTKTLR